MTEPEKPNYDPLRKTMEGGTFAYYPRFLPLLDRAVWLEARVDQLEKALRKIDNYMPSQTTSDPLAMTAVLSDVREIASTALAGVPAEPVPDPERAAEVIGQLLDRDARAEPATEEKPCPNCDCTKRGCCDDTTCCYGLNASSVSAGAGQDVDVDCNAFPAGGDPLTHPDDDASLL